MLFKFYLRALFITFLFPCFSWASNGYMLGVSAFSPDMNRTSKDQAGDKAMLAPFQYPLSLGYLVDWGGGYGGGAQSLFQLDYSVMPNKTPEGGTSETHLILHLPYQESIGSGGLSWKAGLLLHQTTLTGQGGTMQLNNGTGTSTFAIPGKTQTSRIFSLEAGLMQQFSNQVLLQGSVLVESPFSSQIRDYALLIGLVYIFQGGRY
jgi:hypothetical protein